MGSSFFRNFLFFAFFLCPVMASSESPPQVLPLVSNDALRVVGLVDYIARDYQTGVSAEGGIILKPDEYHEMQDLASLLPDYLERLHIAAGSPVSTHSHELKQSIDQKKSVSEIRRQAFLLRSDLIKLFSIPTYPVRLPSLSHGREIYQQSCAICHGLDGKAQTPTARQLNPHPAALAAPDILNALSPFQAFNTVSYGIEKTSMPAFAMFSEEDRWAVASYLFLLRSDLPAPTKAPPKISYQQAMFLTDAEVKNILHEKGLVAGQIDHQINQELSQIRHLTYRETPLTSNASEGIKKSEGQIIKSVEAYQQGDIRKAVDLAVSAYLDGFEQTETLLNTLHQGQEVIGRVERGFIRFRQAIRQKGDVPASSQDLLSSLEKGQILLHQRDSLSPSLTLLGGFSIIFREGVEAILLLAVIFSVITPLKDKRLKRSIHLSWILALFLGGLTWLLAQEAMTGAVRENMEGWISLLAAVVLVYVSFWLIAKRDAEKWKRFLIGKIKNKNKFGFYTVGMIAFLAVYREAFETVLFVEALRAEALQQIIPLGTGVLLGFLSLILIAWIIFRLGKRIPVQIFFGVSGVFLYGLAVVFVGQGIHNLQIASSLPLTTVPFFDLPTVASLGIFPSLESLVAQGILVGIFGGSFLWQKWGGKKWRIKTK